MNLNELVNRKSPPLAWEEGDNIPWNEPGFSQRMLKEHLSQAHDAASRRFDIIDRQVEWIHNGLLSSKPARILDLACGPGLYAERLARKGHSVLGIDYSPASINYAVESAQREKLECKYILQDIRRADYPEQVDFVMLIYGELNVFRPDDAREILEKAFKSLNAGGRLLLEPHKYRMVKQLGTQPRSWYSSVGGLFDDEPHIVLQENFWDKKSRTSTIRYYVLEVRSGQVKRYAQSMQAYRKKEYLSLITECGFRQIEFLNGLSETDPQKGLMAVTAYK